jgi:uncharacterized paraquat-inducible protein A
VKNYQYWSPLNRKGAFIQTKQESENMRKCKRCKGNMRIHHKRGQNKRLYCSRCKIAMSKARGKSRGAYRRKPEYWGNPEPKPQELIIRVIIEAPKVD